MLGVRLSLKGLIVDPCIPSDWEGFSVKRRWRGAYYNIIVKNPDKVSKGVKTILLNGKPISGPVPPQEEGSINVVEVVMG
jgi:N,N'-diacetylchitobiose phosphorylase